MVNEISTQATDIINNQDDKMAIGMSLGNSSPIAQVTETDNGRENWGYEHDTGQGTSTATKEEDKADYDPLDYQYETGIVENWWGYEHDTGQGTKDAIKEEDKADYDPLEKDTTNYQQKEYEISQEIEKLEELYESIDNIGGPKVLDTLLDYLTDEEIKKATGYNNRKEFMNSMYGYKPDKEFNEIVTTLRNAVKQKIGKQLSELRTKKDSLYDKWDRRTDEQKREDELRKEQRERDDSAYQRVKEDLIKAGYNPAMLSGVNYGGGGGGGGSSKADEEEEKRRRRKREQKLAEQQKRRELMAMLSMLGFIGGSVIRAIK